MNLSLQKNSIFSKQDRNRANSAKASWNTGKTLTVCQVPEHEILDKAKIAFQSLTKTTNDSG